MRVPNQEAVTVADRLLNEDPAFFQITGRHTGIIGVHAEVWCAWKFQLGLAQTGVRAGADAVATENSPAPFQKGDRVQIKGRGSHQTMHITFKTQNIDWLMVVTYDLSGAPVSHRIYLVRTVELFALGTQFADELGRPALPVRVSNGSIRIDWSVLFSTQVGRVRYAEADTWEARGLRSLSVRRCMYQWTNDTFCLLST